MVSRRNEVLQFHARIHSGRSRVATTPTMDARPGRSTTLAALLVILITSAAAAAFVVATPWIIGFGVAVAAAIAWCLWLERHPG
jgi:hypothetical protein